MASAPQMLLSQEAEEEDYDLASRGPYEYQFRVDDPETYNKYEVREDEWMKKQNREPNFLYILRSKKKEILILSRGATE